MNDWNALEFTDILHDLQLINFLLLKCLWLYIHRKDNFLKYLSSVYPVQ